MSREVTTVTRKASFMLDTSRKVKTYVPVNKRAHKWAKRVGKRTRLTRADILAIKATGKVRVYVYATDGVLRHS